MEIFDRVQRGQKHELTIPEFQIYNTVENESLIFFLRHFDAFYF